MKYLTIIWILAVNLAIGQTAFRIQAVEQIKEGDLHLQQGDWERAIISYSNAIQIDETYGEAYYKRAQLFERTTHTYEAQLDYERAFSLNPYLSIYHNDLSIIRFLHADYYGAYNNITSYYQVGLSSLEEDVSDQRSLILYDLYENPRNVDSHLNEALTFKSHHEQIFNAITKSEIAFAQYLIDQVSDELETDFILNDLQALVLIHEELYDDALFFLNKSLALQSDYLPALYNRSLVNRFLHDNDDAIQNINQAIILDSNANFFFLRGLILKESGDMEGALHNYDLSISLDAQHTSARYNRAFTNNLLGNHHLSLIDIDSLIKQDPYNYRYWDLKGTTQLLLGNHEGAKISLDKALRINGNCPECYYHRGLAYVMLNVPISGCEDFEESIFLGLTSTQEIYDCFCGF